MTTEPATESAPIAPPKIELWTAQKMRDGLLSDDPALRLHALAMTVQPNAALDDCVPAIVSCLDASREDAAACQLGAAALSMVTRDSEKTAAVNCLALLAADTYPPAVRIFAAHGMAQLANVPAPAWPGLAQMVFSDDTTMRQVALRAATPFAVAGAPFFAQVAAQATPAKWTTEGLTALVKSAGASDDSKARVEKFILQSLEGQALMPTGVAGYAALAHLNPNGSAPSALAQIAAGDNDEAALASIQALGQMGESAKPVVPKLSQALLGSDDPVREEALCRALLLIKFRVNDVPLPRVMQRIETGPDRAVAAHALLLSVHAKSFAAAAPIIATRYATSGDALKRVLDELHHQLVGKRLAPDQAPPPSH
jgi:hypothetical protein